MQETLNKKQAYEWVVLCADREFILTEKQHDLLIESKDERFVRFDTFTLQPAMVAYAYRQEASDEFRKKYPCKECNTNGTLNEYEDGVLKICPKCQGTGMDL